MVDLLPQSLNVLKEFALAINDAERFIFKTFLNTRISLGIEVEKCEETIKFIDTKFPDLSKKPNVEKQKAKANKTEKKSKTKKEKKVLVENEEHLSINVVDAEDGNSE
jgi:hypothetical protein